MIPQEIKDQIIESIVTPRKLHKFVDPVIFMDESGDPWVVEYSYAHYMEFDDYLGTWFTPKVEISSFDDSVSLLHGVDSIEGGIAISSDNDPEFIEQVLMARQFRRL